jgi:hypothetical protein
MGTYIDADSILEIRKAKKIKHWIYAYFTIYLQLGKHI